MIGTRLYKGVWVNYYKWVFNVVETEWEFCLIWFCWKEIKDKSTEKKWEEKEWEEENEENRDRKEKEGGREILSEIKLKNKGGKEKVREEKRGEI